MRTRDELIAKLRAQFSVPDNIELMNELQDRGLVSDEAVFIEDVPDRDLMRVYLSSNAD